MAWGEALNERESEQYLERSVYIWTDLDHATRDTLA